MRKTGTTVIKASVKKNSKIYAKFKVQVLSSEKLIENDNVKVELTRESPEKGNKVEIGSTLALKATVEITPNKSKANKASNKKLTWDSKNPDIATVNQAGKVTGKKVGKATITATSRLDGSKSLSFEVIVTKTYVESITIKGDTKELEPSQKITLKATVKPKNAEQEVTWKSENESIATVNKDGLVTINKNAKPGETVVIKAIAKDGSEKFGKYTITIVEKKEYVASIGSKKYTTLQEAVNAVSKDNKKTTIKMLRNVSYDSTIIIEKNQYIVLNLNRHTIETAGKNHAIDNYGKLIIKGDGTISAEKSDAIYNLGEMTINGGTITSKEASAILNFGELTISGGTITAKDHGIYNDGGELTVSGGTITAEEYNAIQNYHGGKVTISGGTILSEKDSAIDNLEEGTMIISGNAKIKSKSNSLWILVYNEGELTISGGTITAKDSGIYNAGGNVTVSGGTITAKEGDAISNDDGGELTISGGTITATGEEYDAIHNYHGGKVTINGSAKIKSTGSTNDSCAVGNEGELTISGGTITAKEGVAIENGNGIYKEKGNITISGGTITSEKYYAICNHRGKVTIKGGTIKSDSDVTVDNLDGELVICGSAKISGTGKNQDECVICHTIRNGEKGTATISGGTIIGSRNGAVDNYSGKLTISGGKITAEKGNAVDNYWGKLTISGGTIISKNDEAVYNNGGELIISGGTITAKSGKIAVHNYAVKNNEGTLKITGGKINGKVVDENK